MKPNVEGHTLSLKDRVERKLLRLWDAYVVLSLPMIEEFSRDGVPPERVAMLPPSVDTELYQPATQDERVTLRRAYGYTSEDIVICCVGSITPRKGTDVLIRAFIELAHQAPEYHLLLVGKFDQTAKAQLLQDALQCWLEEAGLAGRVHMVGHVDDQLQLIEFLQLSDIFAFPSRREGLPNALIEAMAVGLPCVSAEMQKVVYDIIEPEQNGIVVRSYDPEEWAATLQWLSTQPKLRSRLGEAARRTIITRFSREAAVERQIVFYHRVLQKSGTLVSSNDPLFGTD